MKIALLSALLVAGSAPFVSAAPDDKETTERVGYSEKAQQPQPEWIEIASPTPASHGRTYVTVDGTLATLRLDAASGRPLVRSVRIRYTDSTERVVRIDRKLGGKAGPAYIDVRGKPIDHIVVITERSGARYAVYGSKQRGGTGVATR